METAPYFSSVHDPRVVGRYKHKLSDILMVALITYLFGVKDYSDMHQLVATVEKSSNLCSNCSMVAPAKTPLSASCKPCIPMR